jgi:hypothetical protein
MQGYLDEIVRRCGVVLGPELSGVYLYGSHAQGESAKLSDIDVLVLSGAPLTENQTCALAESLSHSALPVPAKGLELMVIGAEAAQTLPSPFTVDFVLTTGEDWPVEAQTNVEYEDALLDMAIARASGRALRGPPPIHAFAQVDRARLLGIVANGLEWHRPRILDPIHDPLGQNSVLNAARAWRYVVEGDLVSKVQGGRWTMRQGDDTGLAEQALAVRRGERNAPLNHNEIDAFLVRAIDACREAAASASAARRL